MNLQNLSESFGSLNTVRNTMEKHQSVISTVVHRLFSHKIARIFCAFETKEEIGFGIQNILYPQGHPITLSVKNMNYDNQM